MIPGGVSQLWRDERLRAVFAACVTLGFAVGVFAVSFGVTSVSAGASVGQTCVMSLLVFTGASQFSAVSVLGAGGSAASAFGGAALLAARNSVYGLAMAPHLKGRLGTRLVAAQLTIDESTAMAVSRSAEHDGGRASRFAFWATGLSVFVFWNLATLAGAIGANALGDPKRLGLDAAIPAGFIALVWPRLKDRRSWAIGLCAFAMALVLTPFLQPGVPVLLTASVAVVAGVLEVRRRTDPAVPS